MLMGRGYQFPAVNLALPCPRVYADFLRDLLFNANGFMAFAFVRGLDVGGICESVTHLLHGAVLPTQGTSDSVNDSSA